MKTAGKIAASALGLGVFAGLVIFATRPVSAQAAAAGTLTGNIIDSVSGAGIPGVSVFVGGAAATSDADGNYVITGIPPGTYVVTFSKDGYQTVSQ